MRYMSGNRALIRFQGNVIGVGATSSSHDDDFGVQEIRQLGSAKPAELQDGAHRFTVTLSAHFIPGKALSDMGFANEDEFYEGNEVDIELVDRVTGQVLERYVKCRRTRKSRNYPANAPSTESITFMALDRESKQSLAAMMPAVAVNLG